MASHKTIDDDDDNIDEDAEALKAYRKNKR